LSSHKKYTLNQGERQEYNWREKEVISKAGISNFRILDDPAGLWAEIKK